MVVFNTKRANPHVETNVLPKTSKKEDRIMSISNDIIRIDARTRIRAPLSLDPEAVRKQ